MANLLCAGDTAVPGALDSEYQALRRFWIEYTYDQCLLSSLPVQAQTNKHVRVGSMVLGLSVTCVILSGDTKVIFIRAS